MPTTRWADIVEEGASAPAPAPAAKPLSVPLSQGKSRPPGNRPTSFCRTCGACFYTNKRGKPLHHCRPCYVAWNAKHGRTSQRTSPSPSSTRDGSTASDDAPEETADVGADGLVVGLQRVLARGVSFERGAEPPAAPPEPPPPVPVVPEPLNVMAVLAALQAAPPTPPAPPAPPKPTTVDRGCQTGLAADTEECARHPPPRPSPSPAL